MSVKERVIEIIREMPDGSMIDDLIERILLLDSIEEVDAQLRSGEGIPDDVLKQQLPRLLREEPKAS